VTIPIKVYSASRATESISFNLLHKDCGSRLKQQYVCPQHEDIVPRTDMVKGYEFSKGQYVLFSDEELKTIEEKSTQTIEIVEFVPAEKVDPLYFDRPYYLGPDLRGEKAYSLLARAMEELGRWGIARYSARGRQYFVLLRPHDGGLVMHQLHYPDEIRPFSELSIEKVEVKEQELKLAKMLAEQVAADEFRPEEFPDERQKKLQEMIQRKIAGQEITSAEPEEERGEVVDLMEALKASLARVRAARQRPRRENRPGVPPGSLPCRPRRRRIAAGNHRNS
jgi:DNA end-binding protein Ku